MRIVGRVLQIVGVLTLLGLLLGGTGLYFAGQWMQVHDEPRKADYILPLAGDDHRMLYAADLYKQGYAPRILISRPAAGPRTRMDDIEDSLGHPRFATVEERAHAIYNVLDVPAEALAPFGKGHLSTVEEAEALREFLGPGPRTILVVTSPYHARRAKLVLEQTLPEDVTVLMTVTPYEHFNERWWTDYYTAPKVILESAKILHYLLGGVFRSDGS